jgi:class 3 adenylate cyclase/CheY-like chemotaxis protein
LQNPSRILIVDDNPTNLEVLRVRLTAQGYEIATAVDGEDALTQVGIFAPDLILLDVMMPKLDGIAVVKRLKQDSQFRFIPVILVTAKSDTLDVVAGLDAGADDYLTKPVDQAALLARVRSMLRIKELHDTVQAQAEQLKGQTEQLASWNALLEKRVTDQLAEIERMTNLQRFLAPQVARLVASSETPEATLASHRREITVIFCDLRGFTAFTEESEPEEVMAVLRDYHESLGESIFRHEGMLDRFIGDGIMIVFNDPIPCNDHTARAVRLSLEMRDRVHNLAKQWRRQGHVLGFGIGIACGYATLGQIGFDKRLEYTAIGSVPNLASRLCAKAEAGQIVISQRAFSAVEDVVEASPVGELELKGFNRPIPAYNVLSWRGDAGANNMASQSNS